MQTKCNESQNITNALKGQKVVYFLDENISNKKEAKNDILVF